MLFSHLRLVQMDDIIFTFKTKLFFWPICGPTTAFQNGTTFTNFTSKKPPENRKKKDFFDMHCRPFVGIVIRWLIWLVGEETKFGKELYRDELSLELGFIQVCACDIRNNDIRKNVTIWFYPLKVVRSKILTELNLVLFKSDGIY